MQPHEIRYCKRCGKPMARKRYSNGELECWNWYNRRVYCSMECLKADYREKPKYGTSWSSTHKYARQKKANGCCEICGKVGKTDVHHIDHNPQNNSPENLQRLCRSCHNLAHKRRKVCLICGKPEKGLNLCNKHYIRFKKFGDPLVTKYPKAPGEHKKESTS